MRGDQVWKVPSKHLAFDTGSVNSSSCIVFIAIIILLLALEGEGWLLSLLLWLPAQNGKVNQSDGLLSEIPLPVAPVSLGMAGVSTPSPPAGSC